MPHLRNIFLFLILAGLAACGTKTYDRKLVEIDSLTQREPGKALERLEEVEKDGLSSGDRMYLSLLQIKARGKMRMKNESDSVVRLVVEYFENNDRSKLAETYFYAGCAYRDLGDAPQALEYYNKTIDALPENDNSLMKSSAFCHSGDLYRRRMMREEAAEMYTAAYRIDSLRNDTVGMAEDLAFIGQSYATNLKKEHYNDSLYSYLDRALELAQKAAHPRMVAHISYKIALYHSEDREFGEMQPYVGIMEEYLADHDDKDIGMFYKYLMLDSLMSSRQYDRAREYCDSLLKNDNIECQAKANKFLFQLYAEKGDMARAKVYINEYEHLVDELNRQKAQEATAHVNALYNYQLRERDNLTLKAQNQARLYMIFIICAVALLIVFALWIYLMKQRQQKQTLRQQVARLSQLERVMREQSEATTARQNDARKQLLESEANEMLKQRIEKNKTLKKPDIALLDETVNSISQGFKSTLYSAYNLSAQEYTICLLVKFDVPGKYISQLVGRSASAITQTRKRLFIKLFGREGSANELDTYIRSL